MAELLDAVADVGLARRIELVKVDGFVEVGDTELLDGSGRIPIIVTGLVDELAFWYIRPSLTTSVTDRKVHPFAAMRGYTAMNPPTVISEFVCSRITRPGLLGPVM